MTPLAPLEGAHLLITGGAGFIGTHLTERLCERNHITVFDTLARNALKDSPALHHKNVRLVQGDVCDAQALAPHVANATHIVHLAAIAGVDTVLKNPVRTMTIALLGTYHLLEAARHNQALKCLIDFSTSEVFGTYAYKVNEGNVTSLGAVGQARWTYAVSKLATEHLAHNYWREFQTPTCSIRPFNIFGPKQVGEGAIHHFVLRALKGEPLTVHNDGDQIRSWCYISDIIDGIERCLTNPKAIGEAFNIGNPRNTLTIYALAKEVIRVCQSSSTIKTIPWNQQDVELRIPNIDKARDILGFEPKVDLEEGLRLTLDWYRARLL